MRQNVPSGNILIGESSTKTDKIHKPCDRRMLYVDHYLICPQCGYKVSEDDLKPKRRLVAKDEGNDFIAQPEDEKKDNDDLPPGATVIAEYDYAYGA